MSREQLRTVIREFYAQAAQGEPTRDVFIKMKCLVKKKRLKVISEQTTQNGAEAPVATEAGVTEAVTNATETEGRPKKRATTRRKPGEGGQSRRKSNGVTPPSQVVNLSPAQVCNLWRAAMGGELVIQQTPAGGILCQVSFDSFEKALPVLLDQLGGGAK